ncbi:hypothetical protein Vadar_009641 [Vaccinium darrowii]|uniref:Uncharacterized protein n=1 Tax=Vaccinium darrowii TaxID=229202 RepID=A0ACB7XGV1_9ERIC|nr:hypothetical protein Vadar_009641 [Vaccinium darrowii]
MTVFGHSDGGSSGGFLAGKQVFLVDCEAEVSHRLLEASHTNNLRSALECIADPFVGINFVDAVWLKVRKAEVIAATNLQMKFASSARSSQCCSLLLIQSHQ